MKKIGFLAVLLTVMLCACAPVKDFETMKDVYAAQELKDPAKITLALPEDTSAQVLSGDSGRLYFCSGYEIMVQTMASGDLNQTFRSLTGFSREALTVMETGTDSLSRYECVWTAAGEAGDQVGRAVILDDGNYHYCVSVMAHALEAGSLQQIWQTLFDSVGLQS